MGICSRSTTLTIAENLPGPAEFFFSAADQQVPETIPSVRLHLGRNKSVPPAELKWRTVEGTATPGVRYIHSEGTMIFADGETDKPIDIPILDDDIINGDQQFYVEIEPVTIGYSFAPPRAAITIIDDDNVPIFRFRESRRTVPESIGVFTAFVDRDMGFSARPLTATSFRPITQATFLRDLETARFADGATTALFNITVVNDAVYTGTRTAAIHQTDLLFPYRAGPDMLLDVIDDEPAPFVAIDDATAAEGSTATLHVTLTGPVAVPVEVPFTVAGAANVLTPSPLVFPPGVLAKEIRLTNPADALVEPDSIVLVTLGSVALPITRRIGTCTFVDDDNGFDTDRVQVARGGTASLALRFSAPAATDQTIELASAAPEIAAVPSSIVVAANSRTAQVDVGGAGEGTTTIAARIGGTISTAEVTVYQPLAVMFEPRALTMASGETAVVNARIEPSRSEAVTVELSAHDTAALDVPAAITIPAGGSAAFAIRAQRVGGGSVRARVLAPYGESSALPVDVVAASPAIVRVTPATGSAAGNTSVTISGTHLAAGCQIAFGDAAARDPRFVDATAMTAATPAHAPGAVDVTLTCGGATSVLRGGFTFVAEGKRRVGR